MKKLLGIVLVFFVVQESLAVQLYWNLKRVLPDAKITKKCNENMAEKRNGNSRSWFSKDEVEAACNCLDKDLKIITEVLDDIGRGKRTFIPNDEKENKKTAFFAQVKGKMLNEQQVKTAVSTILSHENADICGEETEKFLSFRTNRINEVFQMGVLTFLGVIQEEACASYLEVLAQARAGGYKDEALYEMLRRSDETDEFIAEFMKRLDEKYPELADVEPIFGIEKWDKLSKEKS